MRAALRLRGARLPPAQLRRSFEGIGRGGASSRALTFPPTCPGAGPPRAVARDLGVPEHYLRLAVGVQRRRADERMRGRLGPHLAIDEASMRKNFFYATVFSDPGRRVVIDMAPGRDAAAVLFFAGLYSHAERAAVRVVTIDCHAPYRAVARVVFPNAVIVADAFHLHRRVLAALTEVRRDAWNRWRHRNRRLGRSFKDARFALARARDALDAGDGRVGERQRLALFDATNLDAPLAVANELKDAFAQLRPSAGTATLRPSVPPWNSSAPCASAQDRRVRQAGQDTAGPAGRDRQLRGQRRGIEMASPRHEPPDQEPEAPGPRLPNLGRVPRPDPLGLRGGRRPRHGRDQAPTIRAPRPGSELVPTSIRVDPDFEAKIPQSGSAAAGPAA